MTAFVTVIQLNLLNFSSVVSDQKHTGENFLNCCDFGQGLRGVQSSLFGDPSSKSDMARRGGGLDGP
jgi:hypothetical protein